MNPPKEIFVRLDRCTGCHSCEVACAVAHSSGQSLFSALTQTPTPKPRLYVEWVSPDRAVPIVCRHCEDAPCMHACIAGAISRTPAGTIATDRNKCIGCWTCVMVCPYGVIGPGGHKEYRCDRCPELELPACVGACPTAALAYRERNQTRGIRFTAAQEMPAGQER